MLTRVRRAMHHPAQKLPRRQSVAKAPCAALTAVTVGPLFGVELLTLVGKPGLMLVAGDQVQHLTLCHARLLFRTAELLLRYPGWRRFLSAKARDLSEGICWCM